MLTYEEFIEDQEFVHLVGEFYECPGGHQWTEYDIEKHYEDYLKNPKDFITQE